MATEVEVPTAASLVGRCVFRQPYSEEAPILECLHDQRVRTELSAIIREGVTFLFCSSAQLLAEFESSDSAVSVRRIRALQSLQLALYEFRSQ